MGNLLTTLIPKGPTSEEIRAMCRAAWWSGWMQGATHLLIIFLILSLLLVWLHYRNNQ